MKLLTKFKMYKSRLQGNPISKVNRAMNLSLDEYYETKKHNFTNIITKIGLILFTALIVFTIVAVC